MNIVSPSDGVGNHTGSEIIYIEKLYVRLEYSKIDETRFRNYIEDIKFYIRDLCYMVLEKWWAWRYRNLMINNIIVEGIKDRLEIR